jgi:hypothetical protein
MRSFMTLRRRLFFSINDINGRAWSDPELTRLLNLA